MRQTRRKNLYLLQTSVYILSDFISTTYWVVFPLQIPKKYLNKTIWEERLTSFWNKPKSSRTTDRTPPSKTLFRADYKTKVNLLVNPTFQSWNHLPPALWTWGRVQEGCCLVREAPAAEMIIRLGRLTPGYFRLLQVSHKYALFTALFLSFWSPWLEHFSPKSTQWI